MQSVGGNLKYRESFFLYRGFWKNYIGKIEQNYIESQKFEGFCDVVDIVYGFFCLQFYDYGYYFGSLVIEYMMINLRLSFGLVNLFF